MESTIQAKIEGWEGLAVISRYIKPYDAWIFIALHSNTLGVPVGGTRMTRYAHPSEGLEDAMRLASGMTAKWASCGLDFGGATAVIALSRRLEAYEHQDLLCHYGDLLQSLGSVFITGEDLGTTPEDMNFLLSRGARIMGISPYGEATDPGPYTALGVYAGMNAALAHALPGQKPAETTVLIQGIGDVGERLAAYLHKDGFRLKMADLNDDRVDELIDKYNAEKINPAKAYKTACDVFAPCARGGILSRNTIPELRCKIVAGSANNQLLAPDDAQLMHERGILYAPDYVINAGGAIVLAMMDTGVFDEERIKARILNLGPILSDIFDKAAENNESPLFGARRHVEQALAKAREERF